MSESLPRSLSRESSRGFFSAAILVLAVLILRLIYLRWLNPWELVADEAHYWEWSRRLDWSYYTKGPGVAWVIWLSTSVFGVSEFAVRAPSAIAAAVMTLIGARFAADATDGRTRAAWYAAIALLLAPAFFSLSQLLTTDIFCSTGWLAATWLVFLAVRSDAKPSTTIACVGAAGFVIGAACLFKYTALLLLPGLAMFFWIERRRLRFGKPLALGLLAGTLLFLVASSPIVIWNAQRGWPTIAHQVGRLRLPGGDETVKWNWSPLWFFTFVGAQFALLSVIGMVLIGWSIVRERQWRREGKLEADRALAGSLLLSSSIPLLAFYLIVSVFRQTQGNWAVAGYSTLLTFAGIVVAQVLREPYEQQPPGKFGRVVKTPFKSGWHWYIGVGCVAGLAIALGPNLAKLPGLRNINGLQRATQRANGATERGKAMATAVREIEQSSGKTPLIITDHYQEASLLAFYMPGHPTVYCAASGMGARPNAYDFFPDTDLTDPSLIGRDAVLVGASRDEWLHDYKFRRVESIESLNRCFYAKGFAGHRSEPLPTTTP